MRITSYQRVLKSTILALIVTTTGVFATSSCLDLSAQQDLPIIINGSIVTYRTCPTLGDGNCFFHAAFTENGENEAIVRQKAAYWRAQLCDTVQNDRYVNDLKPLVYEHFLQLHTRNDDHHAVPAAIKTFLNDKNEYEAMRQSMIKFGIPMAGVATAEQRFPMANIVMAITAADVKQYIERFRQVGGESSYIPIRPNMVCPAEILARLSGKSINIFTFLPNTQQLQFVKKIGYDNPTINLLLSGAHYVRLQDARPTYETQQQCAQIMMNTYMLTMKW